MSKLYSQRTDTIAGKQTSWLEAGEGGPVLRVGLQGGIQPEVNSGAGALVCMEE